jgi:hypothetical protein
VAGSGRRGGVPVEGGSGGVAAASGVVLRLEAEARGSCGHCVGAGRKARRRGGSGRRQHPFKGGAAEGARGKSGDAWKGTRRGPWLPPVGHNSGGAATADSGPVAARAGGTRVRTVAGGAGSLASGVRLTAGRHRGERRGACVGRPRKEMEWAELGENTKWVGPG